MGKEAQGGKLYRGLARSFGPFLGVHGFQCTSYRFDEAVFGNELIEFVSGDVHLRLINDRDQYFADIGHEAAATWFATNDLMELLNVPAREIAAGMADMVALAKLVSRNYGTMLDLLGPGKFDATRQAVIMLKESRPKKPQNVVRNGQTLH
jgi:hypothetical protein